MGALKQKVARSLQRGERRQALGYLSAYQQAKKEANAHLMRDEVDVQLRDVEALQASVEESFSADAGAPARRNSLSKKLQLEGVDSRRVGAKTGN